MSSDTQKVALVTGSSRGIGAATAIHLAEQGFDVCINYTSNETAANQVADKIKALGRKALVIKADVSNESDVKRLFDSIDNEFGRLDALVNNAGILFKQCRIEDMDAERINNILSTNVTSAFICSIEAIKRMSTKHGGNGGAIVNVSSAAARLGSAGEYVDYASSKGAIDTFTIGLANEVADEGIRVNGVRPGVIYTDIHSDGGEPGRVDRLKDKIPLKRGGTAKEVAAAITWLISDDSSYTTSSFIEITGGR